PITQSGTRLSRSERRRPMGCYGVVGSCSSACCLIRLTSPLVTVPLALMSLRKLLFVTGCSACALLRFTSPVVTTPLALTSPINSPMTAETLPENEGHAVGTLTPLNVTVVYWALGRPVRFTVH